MEEMNYREVLDDLIRRRDLLNDAIGLISKSGLVRTDVVDAEFSDVDYKPVQPIKRKRGRPRQEINLEDVKSAMLNDQPLDRFSARELVLGYLCVKDGGCARPIEMFRWLRERGSHIEQSLYLQAITSLTRQGRIKRRAGWLSVK